MGSLKDLFICETISTMRWRILGQNTIKNPILTERIIISPKQIFNLKYFHLPLIYDGLTRYEVFFSPQALSCVNSQFSNITYNKGIDLLKNLLTVVRLVLLISVKNIQLLSKFCNA